MAERRAHGDDGSDPGGQVDNCIDVAVGPDGTDDGLLGCTYTPRDLDGTAVQDHVEFASSSTPMRLLTIISATMLIRRY